MRNNLFISFITRQWSASNSGVHLEDLIHLENSLGNLRDEPYNDNEKWMYD